MIILRQVPIQCSVADLRHTTHFENNIFLADLRFFERPDVRHFLEAVSLNGRTKAIIRPVKSRYFDCFWRLTFSRARPSHWRALLPIPAVITD